MKDGPSAMTETVLLAVNGTLMRGLERVRLHAYIVAAAYNLLRMSRLRPATP